MPKFDELKARLSPEVEILFFSVSILFENFDMGYSNPTFQK
jgi:hypothetical protein